MAPTIVIKFQNEKIEDLTFHDAEVAVTPPGIFVIQNNQGTLAMFPIPHVAGIIYPLGSGLIQRIP